MRERGVDYKGEGRRQKEWREERGKVLSEGDHSYSKDPPCYTHLKHEVHMCMYVPTMNMNCTS